MLKVTFSLIYRFLVCKGIFASSFIITYPRKQSRNEAKIYIRDTFEYIVLYAKKLSSEDFFMPSISLAPLRKAILLTSWVHA